MRVVAEARDIVSEGLGVTKRATVLMNAKFAKIFSSQIYSDKPLAIIGEICANAWDSHRAAGKSDIPFVLKLPTILEKTLRISDYGVGMSHDFMMNEYTVLLHSPKDQDDAAAGGFGLGRMTMLAYTDSFVVQCRDNGKLRSYVVYKDDEGIPCVSYVGTIDTLEPNGVDVIMDVAEQDITAFINAAKFVVPFMEDPAPKVLGADISPMKWKTRTNLFGRYNKDLLPRNYQIPHIAVVGPRAYKLNLNAWEFDTPEFIRNRVDFALFFDINEVEVTPSREMLSLSPKTIAAVKARIDLLKTSFFDDLVTELQAEPDIMSALQFWNENFNTYSMKTAFGWEPVETICWNGVSFQTPVDLVGEITRFSGGQTISWRNLPAHTANNTVTWLWLTYNSLTNMPTFVYKDTTKNWQKVVRQLVKDARKWKQVILFTNLADFNALSQTFKLTESYKTISELHEEFFPKKERAVRIAIPMRIWTPFLDNWSTTENPVKYMQDNPGKYYYVLLNRNSPVNIESKKFWELVHYAPARFCANIIGIPQTHKSWVKKLNLPGFEQFLEDKVAFLDQESNLIEKAQNAQLIPRHTLDSRTFYFAKVLAKSPYISAATRAKFAHLQDEVFGDYRAFNFLDTLKEVTKKDYFEQRELPAWFVANQQLNAEFPELQMLIEKTAYNISWWSDHTQDKWFRHGIHNITRYITQLESLHECLSAH